MRWNPFQRNHDSKILFYVSINKKLNLTTVVPDEETQFFFHSGLRFWLGCPGSSNKKAFTISTNQDILENSGDVETIARGGRFDNLVHQPFSQKCSCFAVLYSFKHLNFLEPIFNSNTINNSNVNVKKDLLFEYNDFRCLIVSLSDFMVPEKVRINQDLLALGLRVESNFLKCLAV